VDDNCFVREALTEIFKREAGLRRVRRGSQWARGETGDSIDGSYDNLGNAVLPPKKLEQFRRLFETRIAELESTLVSAQRETRVDAAKHADPGDQAASEYERQALIHKAAAAQHTLRTLKQALERLRQGSFGECAECGGDIEPKRLEAIPWARYCVNCQEARERR
jgi:DnaK suppressor protein